MFSFRKSEPWSCDCLANTMGESTMKSRDLILAPAFAVLLATGVTAAEQLHKESVSPASPNQAALLNALDAARKIGDEVRICDDTAS